MAKKITPMERLTDYAMIGPLEEVRAGLTLMLRIVNNRVAAEAPPAPVAAKKPRKRRTRAEIASDKAETAKTTGA